MTTMINNYHKTQAASAYILGFILNRNVYRIALHKLGDEYFKESCESSSHGGYRKLMLHLTSFMKAKLVAQGATKMGTAVEILKNSKNKGIEFEKAIFAEAGQEWKQNSTPYYIDGDITIGNIKYQIKFQGASFANERTIERALQYHARKY